MQYKRKIALLPRQVQSGKEVWREGESRLWVFLQVWGIDSESSKMKQRGDMGVQLMSE